MHSSSFRQQAIESFRIKVFVYLGVVFGLLCLIIAQLINLQIINGAEYAERARRNMENNIPVIASRGEIYDRNFDKNKSDNIVIVSNRPSFNLSTVPAKFPDKEQLRQQLVNLYEIADIDVDVILSDISGKNPWQRITLQEDVPFDTVVYIASHQELFDKIDWEVAPVRIYNQGSLFSHIVGYIGSLTQLEYDTLRDKGYKYYQKIGKSGVEKQYDELLRGVDGSVIRIVDVKNRTEGELVGEEPVAGNNIVLTMDYNVQKALSDAFQGKVGSGVVIKASTGEIIAMVSKPDYDPNDVISKDNSDIIRKLYMNESRPFLNRAIQSRYPPASTFKLVTTISGLEEEKWNPNWVINCAGFYVIKGLRDTTVYDYAILGNLDLYHAIGKSSSVYFYNMGHKIGPTPIMKYAEYFGMNERSGIDIPGEIEGFIPSQQWKRKRFGQGWYDGDTINLAIGQGFVAVTPIGVADFVCAIVNNGNIYKPHVVKEVRSQNNEEVIFSQKLEKIKEVPLSPETLEVVKTGMRLSVAEGTSHRLASLPVPFAGKTGTAQTRSQRKDNQTQHGWFAGYGPHGAAPEDCYVVVIMVEYGIAGAATAVPIAHQVLSEMIERGYYNVAQE